MFAATGLLGPAPLPEENLPSDASGLFKSNGLLDAGSSCNDQVPGTAMPHEPLPNFQLNGLLGVQAPTESFQSTTSLQSNHILGELTHNTTPPDFSFTSTGLLGEPSTVENSLSNTSFKTSDSIPCDSQPGVTHKSSIHTTSDYTTAGMSFTRNMLLRSPSPTSREDNLPPISEAFDMQYTNTTSSSKCLPSRPASSFVRATRYDGQTLLLRRKVKNFMPENQGSSTAYSASKIGNLLDIPVHRMLDSLYFLFSLPSYSDSANSQCAQRSQATDSSLWVDRYRPYNFTDLVGNEKVARDAMAWLKSWDRCVFGKSKGRKRAREDQENFELDEYHRPNEKFMLLSGPPGFGKTTLAHVIARHAGYEVMEINASDARSGHVVDERIRPTLESGFAIGSTKPVLLVIDEIDGATGAGDSSNTFIHKLLQLVLAKPKRNPRGKEKQIKSVIMRPIICICNDYNASSLAKLRPNAYQIRFNRPADVHIAKRLKEICHVEGLKADSRALATLVNASKGDFRGCLNTLQLIKTRNEDVTEPVIRRATAGMKQADTNVLSVLNSIFTPVSKKRAKNFVLDEEDETRYVARISREIDGSGRESTVATGCFGHYAKLRRHDATLARHEKANEWLSTYDRFSSAMYTDGDFALQPYLSYTLVPFHPLFKERGGEKVERNQTEWEHLQVTKTNEEIYKSLSGCLRTATSRSCGDFRHLVSSPILQVEFAPYINRIISPPLRPVNSQIIRPQEKTLMNRLVDIMAALDLRFVQERTEDGQLSYRLDPPLDVFVTYDGKRAPDISVSRYAVRHLVAGESKIDAKISARDTDIVEKGKQGKHHFFGNGSRQKGANEGPVGGVRPEGQDIADLPPTDFFGRLITVPTVASLKASNKIIEKPYRVSYKFLEGNSAAVRKPIKVGAFM
ncbi:hypothetical protein CVT24_011521 [Panaeolus cyanescens]|uniref:AAA+ ATPase domain-containing protein n=1 Tax=Panaeolus cyanescens TaxID=181874 RepID=A0A409VMG7_9AGAR|nr:hypothetical protein CVT24_011521 [Panaeolus cyanescens]